MDISYHYPPELFDLLVDTIPLLSRSKPGVLDFLRGAGVEQRDLEDLRQQVARDRGSISKYKIVRAVLTRLNERGEGSLRERREVVKRVVEFEDFSSCWPKDQLKAQGLVAQIRKVVNVKDSFTRMRQEREKERRRAGRKAEKKAERLQADAAAKEAARTAFYRLFAERNPQERGRLLEGALTELFTVYGIPVSEPFEVRDPSGGGLFEQVDGLVQLDSRYFLVEAKWLKGRVDKGAVAEHLVRVYHRPEIHGLFISATEFTSAALQVCREAFQQGRIVMLCTLQEIVQALEAEVDLKAYLGAKAQAAIAEKNPNPEVPRPKRVG